MEARSSELSEPPFIVKLLSASFLAAAGVALSVSILRMGWPIAFFLWPVALSVFELSVNPLLRLTGFYRYHSPMLKAFYRFGSTYEIHGGTATDYVLHLSTIF